MSARSSTTATLAADALLGAEPLEDARRHIDESALHESSGDLVGLELEFHLVDLAVPARRPSWDEVQSLVAGLPAMPSGSSVTLEPGGQLELSTPPTVGVAASVTALRADRRVLQDAVLAAGYGTAPLGADPARAPRRINPGSRYVAMEDHFRALGCAVPGAAMMTATAALQVNLDAGPASGWHERLLRIGDLGPVLVAISACSPLLGGTASGWRSSRQQAWHGIDPRRTGPLSGPDPAREWVDYALDAPIMLVTDPRGEGSDEIEAVTHPVGFADWVQGHGPVSRRPTTADLDYHLTTLFPPVRPRGYLELRCLDAVPDRWWPALAAITVALVDNPLAADLAAEHCAPVRGRWTAAARDGLGDAAIRSAALACVDAAARHCAPELKPEVEAYAELVSRGRTPGDELLDRALASDPLAVLVEEARA